MNILVISLAGIGDTLFATPFIHELRTNFPDARIDALVLWPGAREILDSNPHLNNVYQKDLMKDDKLECLRFLWQLRKNNYDVSFNTHPQSRIHYRIVARLINARLCVSHQYENSTLLDKLLVSRTMPQDYSRHCIENNLALLPFVGAKPSLDRHRYEIYLTPDELSWAEDFVVANNLTNQRLLGIHIGSGQTKNLALRRWPLKSYRDLLLRVTQELPDVNVLLFGGPAEEKDHQLLVSELEGRGARILQPRTKNLRHTAALLKKCNCFVSVDTSLMHLAGAVEVPHQLVIETPTWNRTVEPYRDSFVLIRNPAVAGRNLEYYRYDGGDIAGTADEIVRCMESVSVEDVFRAVTHAFAE